LKFEFPNAQPFPTHRAPWAKFLPVAISAGLLAWLVWRVRPVDLQAAAAQLDWSLLLPLTALLVFALYSWDAFCLRWLFGTSNHPVTYSTAIHSRGTSYLVGAFNYELGQGVVAWMMSRAQGISLLSGLGRCALLTFHDISVLLGLGLLASLASTDPRVSSVRVFCAAALAGVMGIGIGLSLIPGRWRTRLHETRWGAWIGTWSWTQSAKLYLLRGAYYAIILAYAAAALHVAGVRMGLSTVCSVIPLVLLADGLPISISGLGTRETTLLYLLQPDQPAVVLAFSLIWSVGLMIGRLGIGLGHLWIPRWASYLSSRGTRLGNGVL